MRPLFIESSTGSLFAMYWPSAGEKSSGKAIIHIPSFTEEMNKSRRMVVLQAQAIANQGHAVLVLDLFGTGDSAGDFGDATWSTWLQNIETARTWLKQEGVQSVALWGLRLGALLAMDFANRNPQKIGCLLCWQPVINGDTFITQFLRLRVAAAMMDSNAPQEKTSELKQQLQEGQAIEVAGYLLNPDLIKPLIALRADRLDWKTVNEVAIFEVVSSEDNPANPGNTQLLATLQQKNIKASLTKVVGNTFWASQEISETPALIKSTSEWAKQWL